MKKCSVKQLKTSVNIGGLEKFGEFKEFVVPVVTGSIKPFSLAVDLAPGDPLGVLVEGSTLGSNTNSQNVRCIYSNGQSSDILMQYKVDEFKSVTVTENYKGIYVGLPQGLIESSGNAKITLKIPFNSTINNKSLVDVYQESLTNGSAKTINVGNLDAGLYYIECTFDDTISFLKNTPIDLNAEGAWIQNLSVPCEMFAFSQNKTNVNFLIGVSKFSGSGNLTIKLYKVNTE